MARPARQWVQLDPAEVAARRAAASQGTIQIDCTNGGIGDVVTALGCVTWLNRHRPAERVLLLTRRGEQQWARLFAAAFDLVEVPVAGVKTVRPVDTYDHELNARSGRPRREWYAEACGTGWQPPEALEPPEDARRWAEPYRGAVVLAPWSSHRSREWLPSRWLHLESLLLDRGYQPVIIEDVVNGGGQVVNFQSPRFRGEPATRIAALMRISACVVANDSGMAHVGAVFSRVLISLLAQQKGHTLYGGYPAARWIDGPLPCSGCHWRGQWGWFPICDQLCSALQLIEPRHVLAQVPSYSLLTDERLEQLKASVHATRQLPGAMAEVGTFRGGSAREMLAVAGGRELHVFDTFTGLPLAAERTGQYAAPMDLTKRYLAGFPVVYHVGRFPEVLPPEGTRYSCVHLDGDLYSTTRDAIAYFWPRLCAGGHLVFDDVGQEPGVDQALAERGWLDQVERCAPGQGRLVKPHG